MDETTRIFTLKSTCKVCHTELLYTRTGSLKGRRRAYCDDCRWKKGHPTRMSVVDVKEG